MHASSERTPHQRTTPGMLLPIKHLSGAILMGAILMIAVVLFGFVLAKSKAVTTIDLSVDRALSRAQVVPLTDIAAAIYKLFSPTGAIALTIVATLIIWAASRNWRSALTFAVVVAASWLSSDIVKILVHRPRPSAAALAHPYLPTPPDASFPSGHVVFAASIAIALIYLARSTTRVALVIVLGVVGTVVVAVAVVNLGVHYPTDVIASILWSVGASTLVLALWNHFVIPRLYPTPPPRMPAT
jgi:membrane-associated phospholipid phosphatase